MKRFGSLKNLKIFKSINSHRSSVVSISSSISEEPASPVELCRESSEDDTKTKLTFKELLFSFLCTSDDDNEAQVEAYNLLKQVFKIEDDEAEKVLAEVSAELKTFKFQNIMEHSLLLMEFWKHESNQPDSRAISIFATHSKFKQLNATETSFAKWIAMNTFQTDDVLRTAQLTTTGKTLAALIEIDTQTGKIRLKTNNDDVAREFWRASELFMRSCLEYVENLADCESTPTLLTQWFKAANVINSCKEDDSEADATFSELVTGSLGLCVSNKLHNLEKSAMFKDESSLDRKLSCMLIFLTDTIKMYKKMLKAFEEPFQQLTNFNFKETLFKTYDDHLWKHFRPVIIDVCKKEKISPFSRNDFTRNAKMLQLFLEMKTFSNKGLKVVDDTKFQSLTFVEWFSSEADHSCDCPMLSAIPRITKALSMENYVVVDGGSTHSSSAVDVVGLIDSVIRFWENEKKSERLNLEAHKFIKFVTSDVCRLISTYLNVVVKLVDDMECLETLQLLTRICVIINNLNFVEKNLQALIVAFILATDKKSIKLPLVMRRTLKLTVAKKSEVLRMVSSKTANVVKNQVKDEDCEMAELQIKTDELVRKNLAKADCISLGQSVHEAFIKAFHDLVNDDEQIRSSHEVCKRIQSCMQNIERTSKVFDDSDVLSRFTLTEDLLHYYSLSTKDLIQEYYVDRYKQQQQNHLTSSSDPALSVESYFTEKALVINIWHGTNFVDKSNEPFESYVKFRIAPEDSFPTFQDMKTKIFKTTPFPLYEECFRNELTRQQRYMKNAVIHFIVKDKNMVIQKHYVGEAFLSFGDIEDCTTSKRTSAKHLSLPLSKLEGDDLPSLKLLRTRSKSGDEIATEFLMRKVDSIKNLGGAIGGAKMSFKELVKKLPAVKIGKNK